MKCILWFLAGALAATSSAAMGADRATAVPGGAVDFGPNVMIFEPGTPDLQAKVSEVFAKQERAQFGSGRVAILLKPGKYDLDVQVGFYTQVAGLGRLPDDVEITGAVRVKAGWMGGNATCNFWRSAENLAVTPTQDRKEDVWAVAQGTSMRRVHVKGNMSLAESGWSSGGFLADSKVDGRVNSISQQQWLSRNTEWGSWTSGVWNMVFVGARNAPGGEWPKRPYTVVARTPVIREKPYLVMGDGGGYGVMVPELRKDSEGVSWGGGESAGKFVPIAEFYVARPDKDTAATINAALTAGKHLLLTPGIYHLDSAIEIAKAGTVVLGLGFPTLVAEKGLPAMKIADVDGVKVAGLLLEAGPAESPALVEVGPPGSKASHAADPTFLWDVHARAGGASAGSTDSFMTIHSNDVVGDNFWLWRADHGAGAKWGGNKNRNGITVNGKDVTIYGLFVEHCQGYQTIWNGEGGRVYFYQSEMPYDPPSQDAWSHDGINGYASYKVADGVKTHEAWGIGIYCFFDAAPVLANSAIEAPETDGVKLHHLVTIRLSGKGGSGISHVLNQKGEPVVNKMKATLD